MASERWKRTKKAIYNISYHLIWCPKYRRKVLIAPIDVELKRLLILKAKDIGLTIDKMEIMPDHVHLFVKANPTSAPHWIVQQLKGYTSRILRQKFKSLRSRIPSLWTRSYYCESIGHISETTVKKYIQDQKNK